jgi:hypothetical protein
LHSSTFDLIPFGLIIIMSRHQALEVTVRVGTVESCLDLLQDASNREFESVVITLEGMDDRGVTFSGDMAGMMMISDEHLLRVFRTLTSSLRQLQHVRLEWNMITATIFEQPPIVSTTVLGYLLQNASLLKSLSLYRVLLSGDYQQFTRETLKHNTTLQTIRLEFCTPLSSPNLDTMVTSFASLPQLRHLEVIGFQGSVTRGITSTSLQTLGPHNTPHLRSLKLWGGILQHQDPYAICNLSLGLLNNNNNNSISPSLLKDLEIGLFQLDKISSEALAQVLRTSATLERVWFDVNTILDKQVVIPLANAMQYNTSITSFNLVSTASQRQVSSQVMQVFVDMAKINVILRHCTLRTNSSNHSNHHNNNNNDARNNHQPPPDDESALWLLCETTLQFYLKLNRLGRQQLLANTKSQQQWLSAIIGHSNETSIIYYLLSRNPSFISQSINHTGCSTTTDNKRKRHPGKDTTPSTTTRMLPPNKRSKSNPMVSP